MPDSLTRYLLVGTEQGLNCTGNRSGSWCRINFFPTFWLSGIYIWFFQHHLGSIKLAAADGRAGYHFPLPAVWKCSGYPFHHHQHQQYGRAGCIILHRQQNGGQGCIHFHGRPGCIPFRRQLYGGPGCILFYHQQYGRAHQHYGHAGCTYSMYPSPSLTDVDVQGVQYVSFFPFGKCFSMPECRPELEFLESLWGLGTEEE